MRAEYDEPNNCLPESLRFDNAASGPLPTELGNLSKLSSLVLTDSYVTGDIPSELGRLSLLGKPRCYCEKNWITLAQILTLLFLFIAEVFDLSESYELIGTVPAEVCELRTSGNLISLLVLDSKISCSCCE